MMGEPERTASKVKEGCEPGRRNRGVSVLMMPARRTHRMKKRGSFLVSRIKQEIR